jgi:hypothetical protein
MTRLKNEPEPNDAPTREYEWQPKDDALPFTFEQCRCYHAPEEHLTDACGIYGCDCQAHWMVPNA